jgi:hypothetical protein
MTVEPKTYQCTECGHQQTITTNHHGKCLDYCKHCSWRMGQYSGVMMFGHMYRTFEYVREIQESHDST